MRRIILLWATGCSTLVQRQSGQTKGAAQMVQMIAEISEKFAMSSESVLKATEDQAKAMQEVLDVAQNIRLAVSELNKMIGNVSWIKSSSTNKKAMNCF